MTRNAFWTDSLATLTAFVITTDDLSSINFSASSTTLYENEGSVGGTLSTSDTIDFVAVKMTTDSAYSVAATGSFRVDIEVFDSEGYLLLSTDGDDIGLPDPYPFDSIFLFTPDVSDTYYISVSYLNGDFTGTWGLAVSEDINGDLVNSNGVSTPTVSTTPSISVVSGSTAADNLVGASGADEMWGGSGDDTIDGGADADVLYGNKGLDQMFGGDGSDILFGGQNSGVLSGSPAALRDGVETINGGGGDDVIYGNHGSDLMIGGTGGDSLFGGQDDDTLSGGAGVDRLAGNLGDDLMNGGADADTFIVGAGNDIIQDFSFGSGDLVQSSSGRLSITDGDTGALVSFDNGSSVTLVGVSAASITDSFFV